jgi:NusA-like KH domain protein
MSNTINMQVMRYINLFERISRVSTTNCFVYNNTIVFAVPKKLVSRAIGKDAENVRRVREILGKKARVIQERDINELDKFIADIVEPAEINGVSIENDVVVVNANRQNKASLIGRERAREKELQEILKSFYNLDKLKIV